MLSFILILFLTGDAQAQSAPGKHKLNTDLYEQESEEKEEKTEGKSFTAKVKVVRDDGDGVEVFFEGEKQRGAYSLLRSTERYGKILKILENSRKPQGAAVTVTVDADKRIKNVEAKQASGVPSDPNKAWDFGNIPD